MQDVFARRLDSPMGRLDVRVKLALGFTISVLSVLADRPGALAALALAGLVACASGRPGRAQVQLIAFSSLLMVWGLMFSQGLFYSQYPRTVLFEIWPPGRLFREGLNVYTEGIHYGMVQSLRMLAVMLTGYAVCFTTEPSEFFLGLTAMRVPFALSFMAVTAIRFVPVAAREFTTVRQAMRLRGYRPFANGLGATLAAEASSLRPILAGAIRRSEEIAVSIVTRGFSIDSPRTSLREIRLSGAGWLALIAMGATLLTVGSSKVLFWLYQEEIHYHSSLRPLYQLARDWL